jgi:hypothetical protein
VAALIGAVDGQVMVARARQLPLIAAGVRSCFIPLHLLASADAAPLQRR